MSDNGSDIIALEYCETLSEVTIDHHSFRVTWHPMHRQACILWFRDARVSAAFEALGQFSKFDKRRVLQFIVRYSTSEELRREIDRRRFAGRMETFDMNFFTSLVHRCPEERVAAFKLLFDLAGVIERQDLEMKRRMLARKHHPDVGGDHRVMQFINEAYETLLSQSICAVSSEHGPASKTTGPCGEQ